MRQMNRQALVVMGVILITLVAPVLAIQKQSVKIEFTKIPSAGEGAQSKGDIAGTVTGLEKAEIYKIVIYAHADEWYVQPLTDQPYTDIAPDGRWSNWTHLGNRYAALVVRSSFPPPSKTQSLPRVGGDVVASAEVSAKIN